MNQKFWNVIGVMSGTSLDGVDIVYTRISKNDNKFSFEILNALTSAYTKEWEQKLRNAFTATKSEIKALDIAYGKYLGEIVNEFISKNDIKEIDFIASHGHTIFHKPEEGYTLQIGNGQEISNKTGLKVICDFRTQDVKLGGQGAPLVPIGDKLLFSNYDYCLNLGGFANISFDKNNERIAFDICPVNIALNHYAKTKGLNYDDKGVLAAKGNINKILLDELNQLAFYKAAVPKSLGFEFVKENIFPITDKYQLEIEDILSTLVAHIVTQIVSCFNNDVDSKVLVTGGGVFNSFLINQLKNNTKNEIVVLDNQIINFKEALIFALLGVLRSDNQINCLSSVTGAKIDHSSGVIFNKYE